MHALGTCTSTASATVTISSAILAFLALASVGRVRVRMAWNDMLLMGAVYGDVEMNENRDDGSRMGGADSNMMRFYPKAHIVLHFKVSS